IPGSAERLPLSSPSDRRSHPIRRRPSPAPPVLYLRAAIAFTAHYRGRDSGAGRRLNSRLLFPAAEGGGHSAGGKKIASWLEVLFTHGSLILNRNVKQRNSSGSRCHQ